MAVLMLFSLGGQCPHFSRCWGSPSFIFLSSQMPEQDMADFSDVSYSNSLVLRS